MTEITREEATALVSVLSLAENHPMWSNPMAKGKMFKDFLDAQYKAIQITREFLKRSGVPTMYELMQRAGDQSDRLTEGEQDA